MNHEKYKDPTAEYAIAEAEKWERQQKRLEEMHGIKKRGCYSDHTNQLCFW